MKLHRACWVLALATALGASGCIVDVVFDPVGSDASVQGAWLVNGAAPTAESCGTLGISNVRVRFFDGARTFDHADLVYPCAEGAFDTRPQAVLADGVWTMQLLAIDASGAVIAEGPRETYDTLAEGGHIVMTTVDFEAAAVPTQVAATWTIDGATPNATNCGELGLTMVGIDFMDGQEPSTVACANGSIAVDVLPGSFNVQVIGYDASGTAIAMAMAETFSVNEGMTHTLNGGAPIDFVGAGFNPAGTDAALDADWTVGTTAASAEACEVSGGTTVEFEFYETTDTARAEGVVVAMAPCSAGTFTSTGNVLRAGTYLVSMIYRDAADAIVGTADFAEVTVAAGNTLDLTGADLRLVNSTISFAFGWQPKGGTGYVDCADANAPVAIYWDLGRADTGTTTFTTLYEAPTMAEACEDRLTFSAATSEPVTPGDYDLLIEGFDGGIKAWTLNGVCELTLAAEGDLAMIGSAESCKIDYAAGG